MRISDWSSDVSSAHALSSQCRPDNPHLKDAPPQSRPRGSLSRRPSSSDGRAGSPYNPYACWRASSPPARSEEHPSELQSLMRISYAVFCLKKNTGYYNLHTPETQEHLN